MNRSINVLLLESAWQAMNAQKLLIKVAFGSFGNAEEFRDSRVVTVVWLSLFMVFRGSGVQGKGECGHLVKQR